MSDKQTLPSDAAARADYPLDDGLFGYFPAALAYVARVSKVGNDQHNPGQPMHWDRSKSRDHGNKLLRHHLDAGKLDTDGLRHSGKRAWRALADLQEELEREEGAPKPRNARDPEPVVLPIPVTPVEAVRDVVDIVTPKTYRVG